MTQTNAKMNPDIALKALTDWNTNPEIRKLYPHAEAYYEDIVFTTQLISKWNASAAIRQDYSTLITYVESMKLATHTAEQYNKEKKS